MPKLLSIIIPSYNMENFLPYCLDSLLVKRHQNLIEILIVNDGSDDGTLIVGQKYASALPDLFHVIDKKNGNYGSCINASLPKATGKYVKVLDADDSFNTTNFDEFIDFLNITDADLILSDFEVVDENRIHRNTVHYDFPIKNVMPFIEFCDNDDFVSAIQMHAVTYKRELLLKMGYHQTEGISYTDQQWIFTPMICVQSVAYFDKIVYRYLVGREGQTMDPKVKMRSMEHARKNSLGLVSDYETYKKNIINQRVRTYLYSRLAWYIKDIYVFYISRYNKNNATTLREYDQKLQYLSQEIYDMIGSKKVSSFYGFAYIDYWRKHQVPTLLVKLLGHTYKSFLNIRARKNSANNNLSVGN